MKNYRVLFLVLHVIHYAQSETSKPEERPDPSFRALPLCDSSILVTWKPYTGDLEKRIRYTFFYREFAGGVFGPKQRAWRTANLSDGQIKLNDFKENTKYKIIIDEEIDEGTPKTYSIDSETRKIDFSEPAKPEFGYKILREKVFNSNIKITWFPCGKQFDCQDEAPGCNFQVKYRMKGAEKFKKISEYYEDYAYVRDCLPGKVYEFVVVSNNLPSETESDVREIVVTPEAGPVENLNVLPLGSFGALITWEPPQQLNASLTGYKLFYEDVDAPYKFIYREQYEHIAPNRTGIILSYLQPNTDYRISIVPLTDLGLGATNTVKVHTYKNEIATSSPYKPQALYDVIDAKFDLPKLKIVWLPCGVEKNCGDRNAGSYFKIKYKLENETAFCELAEYDRDFVVVENLLPNFTYDFIVVSVDQTYETESDARKVTLPSSGQRVVEAVQGSNVTIRCNRTDQPEIPPTWLRNESEIKSSEFIPLQSGDLQIRNVSTKNSAKYACAIPSSPLTLDNIVFLLVKKKTKVNLTPGISKRRELNVGQNYILHCEAYTDPSLVVYSYRWLKNGKDIDFGTTADLSKGDEKTLKFSNTTVDDAASYSCVVDTRLDSASDSVEIIVKDVVPRG